MRKTFFPLNDLSDIVERKTLIMSEFHVYLPDDAPVYELMQLSEKAHKIREDRRKAQAPQQHK